MAIPRSSWTSHKPDFTRDGPKRSLYIHHTVTRLAKPWTRAREEDHMRFLERLHLERGFTGIGYNFVLFPSGRLYEGRGGANVPAAQLNANSGTVAIAFVGDFRSDRPTKEALERLDEAIKALKRKRRITRIGGHRDAPGQSTTCPGDNLERLLSGLARRHNLARA